MNKLTTCPVVILVSLKNNLFAYQVKLERSFSNEGDWRDVPPGQISSSMPRPTNDYIHMCYRDYSKGSTCKLIGPLK
jgi:hypothetical protein